jgi:hypothetical protein
MKECSIEWEYPFKRFHIRCIPDMQFKMENKLNLCVISNKKLKFFSMFERIANNCRRALTKKLAEEEDRACSWKICS